MARSHVLEVPVLSVITELRSRAILKNMGRFDLQILYARAMTKLWEKIEKLKLMMILELQTLEQGEDIVFYGRIGAFKQ